MRFIRPQEYGDDQRQQLADQLRTRGTSRIPNPPRGIQAQSGPRGALLTWSLPDSRDTEIAGWRVYKGDENTLYSDIRDRGTRQCFVELTASATSPQTPLFVSSVNALGIESPKVNVIGSASNEAGSPTMPSVPPGYTSESSGGMDRDSTIGRQLF